MALRKLSFDQRLGARLREERLERKWTLAQMGRKLHIQFNTVHKMENGLTRITCERLGKAAKAFGRSVEFFMVDLY